MYILLFALVMGIPGASCTQRETVYNKCPMPEAIVDTPGGVQYGLVAIGYRLIDDSCSQACIHVEYSRNGGTTFHPATLSGGDGKDYLASAAAPGYGHTVIWDTVSDGIVTETCIVRISPTSMTTYLAGTAGATSPFQVNNLREPKISWVSKPEGTVRPVPLAFSWKFDTPEIPVKSYFYDLDENPPTSSTTNTSVTIPVLLEGVHTFRVFAQNMMLLNSSVLEATFTVDNAAANVPPTIEITSGPSGPVFDNTPTFTYAGHDVDGGVAGYYVSINVLPPDIWTTNTSWTSPELSNVSHTFHVMAQDNEGMNSSIASRTFTVYNETDNIPPTVTITSGPSGTTSDRTPTFTYSGSDPDGMLTGYFVSIDMNPPVTWTANTSWTSPELPPGPHAFHVMARDNLGANSSVVSRSFEIINQPPAVIITGGPSGPTPDDTPTFSYSGSDSDGTVAGYYVSVDVTLPVTWTACSSWTSPALFEDTHTFYVMAQDNDGANSSVASRTFEVVFPTTIYVDGTNGDNSNNGLSWATAVRTIRKGLDLAGNGSKVMVADGIYTGPVNKDLDFEGRSIHLVSANGPENCIIDCQYSGRGIVFQNGETGEARIEGFTIENGNPSDHGGGILITGSRPMIINCLLRNNVAAPGEGGGIASRNQSSPLIKDCVFDNNSSSIGGGLYHWWGNPVIDNCTFINNTSVNCGGGVFMVFCTPTLTRCRIINNKSSWGAGFCCASANFTMRYCVIDNNQALYSSGGGLFIENSVTTRVINCRITNNTAAKTGGGIYSTVKYNARITGCTIANNVSDNGGGIGCFDNAGALLENCILWDNIALGGAGHQIMLGSAESDITLQYCDYADNSVAPNNVAGVGTVSEAGSIHLDPMFVNAATGDYRLVSGSPCIDAGNNALVPPEITTGLYGNPRIVDGDVPPDGVATVDMGAYEHVMAIYVDDENGNDNWNGLSWASAVKTIQRGIDFADTGTISNVIVADGVYRGAGNKDLNFNGNPVMLTSSNGAQDCIIDCESAGRAFYFTGGETRMAVVNGFTIQNGSTAGADGAGILIRNNSSPTISNCIIAYNVTAASGGGLFCEQNSGPAIIGCTITENYAGVDGAGVYSINSQDLLVDNCTFSSNTAEQRGAGIYIYTSNAAITNCEFTDNWSYSSGAGAFVYGCDPAISNCTFDNNIADPPGPMAMDGGGIYTWSSNIRLVDCSFKNHIGDTITCYRNSPEIVNCTVIDNKDIGIYIRNCINPIIENCTISGNTGFLGGGIEMSWGSNGKIINCRITDNLSSYIGGGISLRGSNNLLVYNCLIARNVSDNGGGIFCDYGSKLTVMCCTIANNSAVDWGWLAGKGGGIFCENNSDVIIGNSIIWNNFAYDYGQQICIIDNESSVILDYCDFADNFLAPDNIYGIAYLTETNCINSDPVFVNSGAGNFRLTSASPCIDWGNNALVPPEVTTDLDGDPRIVDGAAPWDGSKVDIGAYEYQP
jgi:parallel beta-helix repeat protein